MSRERHILNALNLSSNMHFRSYFVGEEVEDLWWVLRRSTLGNILTELLPKAGLSVGSIVRGSVLIVTIETHSVSAEILRSTIVSCWHRRTRNPYSTRCRRSSTRVAAAGRVIEIGQTGRYLVYCGLEAKGRDNKFTDRLRNWLTESVYNSVVGVMCGASE
jgi:hypothetical protein